MRARGSITIYLSLVLILMLALLFTLLESARVRGLQVDADRMTQAASESVFAEYCKVLLEDYDLFLLDGSYASDSFSAENAGARMLAFLETNADETDSGTNLVDFYQLSPQEVQITEYQLATDDGSSAYYEMACNYAQNALPVSALSDLFEYLTGGEDADAESGSDNLDEVEEALEAIEDASNYGEEENTELTEEEITAAEQVSEETKGILETVSELKEKGILYLLVEDPDSLSAQTLSGTERYSERDVQSGTASMFEGDGSRLLFQWYLSDKFTSFRNASEDHALEYELEYCYAGKDSDLENLESVAEAILVIREGINYAYLQTDSEKKAEARIVALAITGIFAVPALLSVVQQAVLLAWAFLESVKDVQMLLAGETLPLTKTAQNWQTSLSISSITGDSASGSSTGLTYENYLQILLLTRKEEKLIARSLDLIEQNVRLTDGNENFQMDSCIAGAAWEVTWSASPMFLSLTRLTSQMVSGNYSFVSEGTFQYE